MKRLTIVRHAKSSWEDASLSDHERPLSGRGERDAPRMGARLRAREVRPTLLLCSPAERAIETAKIIAHALGFPEELLRREPALYHADTATLFDIVMRQDDACSDLMIVGHNPGLTVFANALLADLKLYNLPTAGIVAIDFATEHWSQLTDTDATLAYHDYPKNPELVSSTS